MGLPVKNLRDGTLKVQVSNDGGGNPGEVEVKLDEGNLAWSESRPVEIISDRGTLDHARRGAEQLIELTFSMRYTSHLDPNSASPTVYEALTRQGAASAWVSQNFGDSDDYSVNLEFTVADPAGGTDEVINFDMFNVTKEDFTEGEPFNVLEITGTAPLVWVDFWWTARDGLNPYIGGHGVFARASGATQIDGAGQIDYAKSGEFRSNHHPNSGGRTGLLEAQRSNGWTYSEELDNAVWTKTRSSISADDLAGPDGYTTADKLVEDGTAASTHSLDRDLPALTNDTDTTITVFAAADERDEVKLEFTDKANAQKSVWFDLAAGTVGTETNATGRIEKVSVGYRLEMVVDSDSGATTPSLDIQMGSGSETQSYNGDGSSGLHLWGIQPEVDQLFASSYIPTTVYPLSPDGYLEFSGAGGNYASTPDHNRLDIVGDIDLRLRIAADDYTPALDTVILGKWTSAGDERSYRLRLVGITGKLDLSWSTDGTVGTTVEVESSVALSTIDTEIIWVRATLDVSNGNVNFYTSDDGDNWTLLGSADQGGGGATSINSGTGVLEIGSQNIGAAANFAGKVYRAQVYDGIAGTLVFDADPQDVSTHANTRITLTEKENSAVVTVFSTSAAATRVKDTLFFPLPRALETPKESTWYFRLTRWVNDYISGAVSHIGSAAAASDPRWDVAVDGSGDIIAHYDGGIGTVVTSGVSAPSDGETVELRTTLSGVGVVGLGSAIDHGAETVETPAAGDALGAAWADTRFYVNSTGTSVPGFGNYSEIIGARRTRTLEHLRKVG